MSARVKTSFVFIGPTRVRVRVTGTGPPLLLIMGLGGHMRMWDPLIKHLPDRELIMFDFPGTGRSGPSWLPPTMGFDALLVRQLIRKLGYQRLDVLGFSWGGMLAQHLAIQHPAVVRRLILASTTVGIGGLPGNPVVVGRMLTPRRYYSRDYLNKIAPDLYGGAYRNRAEVPTDDVRRRTSRPPSVLGYGAQLAAMIGYSTMPMLRRLSAPTLILSGDDDPIVPTYNGRLLKSRIPNSTLLILAGGGHMVLLDEAPALAPVLTEFLDEGGTNGRTGADVRPLRAVTGLRVVPPPATPAAPSESGGRRVRAVRSK